MVVNIWITHLAIGYCIRRSRNCIFSRPY